MSTLAVRREVKLLAAALGVTPDALGLLGTCSPATLKAVRTGLAEVQHARHRRTFRRIGKLAGAVPTALASRVAQAALGPVVSARAAATLEPAIAVKLASSLPTPFLADLSIQLDPARASAIIAGLPEKIVFAVAATLLERREHLTLSRFITVIDTDTAVRVVGDADASALLEVANLAEDDDAVDAVLRALPDERSSDVASALSNDETVLDLLALISRVSAESRSRLLRAVLDSDLATKTTAATIAEHQLADELADALADLTVDERAALLG